MTIHHYIASSKEISVGCFGRKTKVVPHNVDAHAEHLFILGFKHSEIGKRHKKSDWKMGNYV